MIKVHSQDEPLRPNPDKAAQNKDSDQTFALDPNDPARVENRGGLEAAISDNHDGDNNDQSTQNEYTSA